MYSAHIAGYAFAYLSITFSLIIVVVSLLGACSLYQLAYIRAVCIVHTLPLVAVAFVAFLLSISIVLHHTHYLCFCSIFLLFPLCITIFTRFEKTTILAITTLHTGLRPNFLNHSCCVNGWTHSLKSTPKERFFEKLFNAILFVLKKMPKNIFYILF